MLSNERSKLMEHLTCCVCIDTVKNPKLCPTCSKIFCFSCLEQCFAASKRCPHCRRYIRDINQFIHCHWVEQLVEDIGNADTLTTCSTHPGEQLSLFCNNCDTVICSNCFLFGHDHQTHEVSSLKEVCQFKQSEAALVKAKLEEKLTNLLDIQKSLHTSFHKFSKTHEKCFQQMHKTYSESLMLLYNSRKETFSLKSKDIEQLIDEYNMKLHDLKAITKQPVAVETLQILNETLQSLEISEQVDSIDKIKGDVEKIIPSLDSKALENAMKFGPAFSKTVLQLHDFSYLSDNNRVIHSSSLNFCHLSFKLEVHTSGLASNPTVYGKYISVYIIMTQPKTILPENSDYDFCAEVVAVNQYGNKHANKKSMFLLKIGSNHPTTVLVPEFVLKLDSLVQCGYVKEEIDCLVLRFSMRPISYQTLSKIQEDYIELLEANPPKPKRTLRPPEQKAESGSVEEPGQGSSILSRALQTIHQLPFSIPLT